MKYPQMDEGLSEEHNSDWDQKVMSKCRDNEDLRFFRRLYDHSYNPENQVIGENVLAGMWKGVEDRATLVDGLMKIKEVLVKNESPFARRIYQSDFQSRDREDIMLIYPFDSWSEIENRRGLDPDFSEEFEKVHGEGTPGKNGDRP